MRLLKLILEYITVKPTYIVLVGVPTQGSSYGRNTIHLFGKTKEEKAKYFAKANLRPKRFGQKD